MLAQPDGNEKAPNLEFSIVLSRYEKNILLDLLKEAIAESNNESAKRAFEHMLAGVQSATPTTSAVTAPQVGDRMPDGTLYAGVSPDTGRAMYAVSADAPLTYTFNQAQKNAANLDAHGHKDWRVPTKGELNVLFENRAAIGGFNVTGSDPAGWYWSSSKYIVFTNAWAQRFSDGGQGYSGKDYGLSLRFVRG